VLSVTLAIGGFWPVVQLFAPPTNAANAPRTENSFYKFGKLIVGGDVKRISINRLTE